MENLAFSLLLFLSEHARAVRPSRGFNNLHSIFDFTRFVIMQWFHLHKSKTDHSPLPPHPFCLLYQRSQFIPMGMFVWGGEGRRGYPIP